MSIHNNNLNLVFKRKTFHQLLGTYKSNFKGTGIVYKESRPYTPGDPYHRIDRRTSAKKQDLYLKEFEEERELRVLFVVSGGASMEFCSTTPTKSTMGETLGMLLGEVVIQQGDRMSYMVHSIDTTQYLPPSRSPSQKHLFQKALADISRTGVPSLEETARLLHRYRIRHHLIVRVSDQCVTEQHQYVHALAKENDLLYIHLFDPFEYDADPNHFDKTYLQLSSGTHQTISTHTAQTSYIQAFNDHLRTSEHLLTSRGITTIHAKTIDDPFLLFTTLFHKHALKLQ